MVNETISLDISAKSKVPKVIHASQYDSTGTINVSLYDNGNTVSLSSYDSAIFRGSRSDGTSFEYTATKNTDTLTASITALMSESAGECWCEFVLVDSDGKYTASENFCIKFEASPYSEESQLTDEDYQKAVSKWIDDHIDDILEGGTSKVTKLINEMAQHKTDVDADLSEMKSDISDFESSQNTKHDALVSTVSNNIAKFETDTNAKIDAITATYEAQNAKIATAESNASNALASATNANGTADDALTKANKTQLTVEGLETEVSGKIDGAYVENGYLYLTSDNEVVAGPLGPFSGSGGGGGSSGNNAVLTVTNTTGWLAATRAYGQSCPITINWSSLEDEVATGNGVLTITVNGVSKAMLDVAQGDVTVDLNNYLIVGSNTVKVSVADTYGNSRTINFRVNAVQISISSTFDSSTPYDGTILFQYTPVGDVSKTTHFVVDGVDIAQATTTASGRQQSQVIPAQAHGAHRLEVYFNCEINGTEATSNVLEYSFISLETGNTTPIISTAFSKTTAEQYSTISISYQVYDPSSMTSSVVLTANGTQVNALTVDRTVQNWAYRADTPGELTLAITSGTASKEFPLTITESSIDAHAETENLELYLNAYGRSNNEANPATWAYGDVVASLTGFTFTNDGWKSDDDGNTVLRVSGDARVEIPFKPFSTDLRSTGYTIELEFATRDVLDYDSTIISCLNGGRGLEVSAMKAILSSEQSSISTQYKEDDHVRISFVVEKRAENRLVYIYINAIMSGVIQYPDSDNFQQTTPAGITIGSNGCTTDIYLIRCYSNDMTRYQILDNWIADTQNVDEMLTRYNHNHIFDAYGNIVIADLPSDLPYIVLTADELPQYKGDKKTISGYYVDPTDDSKSFTFTNCTADVQGTSSATYARKNYKLKFKNFTHNGNTTETYAMNANAVPTNVFTFKADVASSEGANNVELVRLYNATCPYQTPPQKEDSKVRQGIDGFPIVLFWNNGTDTTFMGKYNFNNDKGTAEVFGFADGDESWETLNNTSDKVLFHSDDFESGWSDDFEARYPEENTDITNLKALSTWLVSTDRTQATGNALTEAVTFDDVEYTTDSEEYRLAKFKAEAADHLVLNACEFYYLFTELFLQVDSRAKNTFPTNFSEDGKWFSLPYDMDTSLGINNEGALVFGYNLEDTDQTSGGADVYNGQQSVLWTNLRDAFGDEIKAMYQSMRSTGKWSYDVVETAFETHQNKWPEAVFNEDAWFKYLQPLVDDNDSAYLTMLQGSKAEQRKWWLYNRFRYIDSKYTAGDALTDVITLRGYAKSDISITPYADIYAAVKYGSYMVQQRAERKKTYTLECPLDNVNDTEIYIYSSSQLKSVGDLSGLKVGYANFSNATKIQDLKIGDSESDYSNGNLTELYLGNNTLLQTLDVRNCPNLAMSIDLSGCTGLNEAYFGGTSITGVSLADGASIKTLELPGTVTNLTLKNLKNLETFTMPSYSNITTLDVENYTSAVDTLEIMNALPDGARVRLIGIDWTLTDTTTFMALLAKFTGIDEAGNNTEHPQISGKLHIGTASSSIVNELRTNYPDITLTWDDFKIQYTWYDEDGTTILSQQQIDANTAVTAPTNPTKSATAQYSSITFTGWSLTLGGEVDSNVSQYYSSTKTTEDRNFYAVWNKVVATYTVKFYSYEGASSALSTQTVEYGQAATAPSNPTRSGYRFTGWSDTFDNITEDKTIYGEWKEITVEIVEITDTWEQIVAACSDGTYAEKYNVGNYKALDLGDYGTVNMQIVGMDKDALSDGSGNAPITWISMEIVNGLNIYTDTTTKGTYSKTFSRSGNTFTTTPSTINSFTYYEKKAKFNPSSDCDVAINISESYSSSRVNNLYLDDLTSPSSIDPTSTSVTRNYPSIYNYYTSKWCSIVEFSDDGTGLWSATVPTSGQALSEFTVSCDSDCTVTFEYTNVANIAFSAMDYEDKSLLGFKYAAATASSTFSLSAGVEKHIFVLGKATTTSSNSPISFTMTADTGTLTIKENPVLTISDNQNATLHCLAGIEYGLVMYAQANSATKPATYTIDFPSDVSVTETDGHCNFYYLKPTVNWSNCATRTLLNGTVLDSLESAVKNGIKEVKKDNTSGWSGNSGTDDIPTGQVYSLIDTNDKIWVPSSIEILNSSQSSTSSTFTYVNEYSSGVLTYADTFFNSADRRIKANNTTSVNGVYSTRSELTYGDGGSSISLYARAFSAKGASTTSQSGCCPIGFCT